MGVINEVISMPVIRPVACMDKLEIIRIAEEINTYDISIRPHEDCCTIFVAKHPVTKPNLKIIKRSETHLEEKIEEMVKTAIDTAETIVVEAERL